MCRAFSAQGDVKNISRISLKNRKRRNSFGDLSLDHRIILKEILRKEYLKVWTGFICFRIGTSGGLL
jgi:hypothetical protein